MAEDVEKVIHTAAETSLLTLNASKGEINATNFDIVDNINTFKDFKRIAPQEMIFLRAPVLIGSAVDLVLQNKVNDLHRAVVVLHYYIPMML